MLLFFPSILGPQDLQEEGLEELVEVEVVRRFSSNIDKHFGVQQLIQCNTRIIVLKCIFLMCIYKYLMK